MTDRRPAFRLGFAPVLLLGWNMALDDPLPFLAPSLLVVFLAGSPARPPLQKLAGAFVLVAALAWIFSRLFVALADSPALVWIVLFALTTAAFARLARRPGDVPAMLTLITASLVVAMRQWAAVLGLAIPWVLGAAAAQAVIATLLAHALLPSFAPAPSPPAPAAAADADAVQALGRSAGLIAALGFALFVEDNSAIFVALTAVSVLAAPAEAQAQGQARMLLFGNAAAAAVAAPILVVATIRGDPTVLLLLALAGGLWMASGIDGAGSRRIVARAGVPVFVLLLGLLLPKAGEAAFRLLVDRLLTLGLVVVIRGRGSGAASAFLQKSPTSGRRRQPVTSQLDPGFLSARPQGCPSFERARARDHPPPSIPPGLRAGD